jgi:hypothetical protein
MRHMPRLALVSAVIAGAIAVALLASTGSASATTSRTTSSSITAQVAELRGSDSVAKSFFGGSVAISGNTAVVGAGGHASLAGAAYVFTESGGVWKQVAELQGSDTVSGDVFGSSVAASGPTALIGAPGTNARHADRVYVFDLLGSVLGPGQGLSTGGSLQSVGGQFSLVMQRDGNLVLYASSNTAIWATGTENNAGASVVMQRDGNLVVYSSSDRALWASGTENNAGASAVLQRDGNFVIYSAGGKALWSSGT